jgi:hypothetical protein
MIWWIRREGFESYSMGHRNRRDATCALWGTVCHIVGGRACDNSQGTFHRHTMKCSAFVLGKYAVRVWNGRPAHSVFSSVLIEECRNTTLTHTMTCSIPITSSSSHLIMTAVDETLLIIQERTCHYFIWYPQSGCLAPKQRKCILVLS